MAPEDIISVGLALGGALGGWLARSGWKPVLIHEPGPMMSALVHRLAEAIEGKVTASTSADSAETGRHPRHVVARANGIE
jgi:hypothetical protein